MVIKPCAAPFGSATGAAGDSAGWRIEFGVKARQKPAGCPQQDKDDIANVGFMLVDVVGRPLVRATYAAHSRRERSVLKPL